MIRRPAALLALALGLCAAGIAGPAGAEARPDPVHTVYVVTWRGCEEACQGLIDYLRLHRVPVEIITRDAEQDRARIVEFVREARALDVDLIVTGATPSHWR